MRLFRLMAITVLLLACVVMGTACAGAKGEQGPKGDTGAQGIQGPQWPAGPNMIVAMGAIAPDGTIDRGYNVDNCTWDTANYRYVIALAGISYTYDEFVTIVTPAANPWGFAGNPGGFASYGSDDANRLVIYVLDRTGNTQMQSGFSFMVLQKP